ncbi:hypothetical protein PC116_g5489 [Phytophthora cactorum]|uniref:Uncharacterized protein n=1 Tax=Phytophthora cactorum TaxID=29920 RepID=A0A8T1LHL7_9STRA|nr:hypothetical protein PC114_g9156 [Phytophthora cactorum]KAG2945573.1 hypothetical protein PC117_g8348 [Phytophthora cactorum]KAG3003757.1 hypothetical protein PC120_g18969 [Phytophthora cactorum]KAG3027107.1 hypothetical protein PC119_g7520 [Phytophthora cactorum]KAG3175689.1 hypothetical protein C6341_g9337 [Phytophthora cactorum]
MVSITASFAFVATAFGIAYGYTEAAAFSEGEYYHPPTLPVPRHEHTREPWISSTIWQ